MNFDYVKQFEKLGFGMFVHFGLYSVYSKGEWAYTLTDVKKERYQNLANKFKPAKNWADELCKTAKNSGVKYITLTTRHHDGFSLYDTKGLSEYDAMHYLGRDLIKEFTDACHKHDIVPFFYHTLLDWYKPEYKNDFAKYIDYLVKSVETLCVNYGKIGGLWFDGMWDKPDEDWQEDRLYSTIRKHQPTAMIINNTGLSELGKVGHYQLDSVTFERGKPAFVDNSDRPRAGEMCQVLNDHWGYAKNDCSYKSVKELIKDLTDCRKYGCNFLLNVGPTGTGKLKEIDKGILLEIGKFIRFNKNFIYDIKPCDLTVDNADIVTDGKYYYAIIDGAFMKADENVQSAGKEKTVTVHADVKNAVWLDSGKKVKVKNNSFELLPFKYGTSMPLRIAKFEIQ